MEINKIFKINIQSLIFREKSQNGHQNQRWLPLLKHFIRNNIEGLLNPEMDSIYQDISKQEIFKHVLLSI